MSGVGQVGVAPAAPPIAAAADPDWRRHVSKEIHHELFTDDEYGLLNVAKFASHNYFLNDDPNDALNYTVSAADADAFPEITTAFPSAYSQTQIVVLAVIMTAMMIVIVVGNMLVVIAIATENNLTSIQNWFIASLAVADLLIGLVVMPFSLSSELMGYWMFGQLWCDIHAAIDVFLCTASIMNICLISLDRYWSITRAIEYLNARTPNMVALMIGSVWILSGVISIPPLLGWKQERHLEWFEAVLDEQGNRTQLEFLDYIDRSGRMSLANFTEVLETVVYPQCTLSKDLGYVMYSAFGSFYIPSCIMVFVYIKIYYAARDRARRNIKARRKSRRKSNRNNPNNVKRAVAQANNNQGPAATAGRPMPSPASMAVGNGAANRPVATISSGRVEQPGLAGSRPVSQPPSALASPAAGSHCSGVKKKTRFSFGGDDDDDGVAPKDEQNGTGEEKEQLMKKGPKPADSSSNNNRKKYPPHPKGKKMVHILSAVSVSLNDSPLSLCDTPPSSAGIDPPISATCVVTPTADVSTGHASHCSLANGMRAPRRSVGVSTRSSDGSDDDDDGVSDDPGERSSSNSESGKVRCLKLRSRFRAPVHGRRPSKETREMIDTGRLRRKAAAAQAAQNNANAAKAKGGKKNKTALVPARLKLDKPRSLFSSNSNNGKQALSPVAQTGNGTSPRTPLAPPTPSLSPSPSPAATPNAVPSVPPPPSALAGRPIPKPISIESEADKEKKRLARKKERRATLILGLIMGSFIACWFPFFFLYSISTVCPVCEESPDSPCCVRQWGATFAFWLGYSNSALNPVIYTVFNKDFRRAFKRILFK